MRGLSIGLVLAASAWVRAEPGVPPRTAELYGKAYREYLAAPHPYGEQWRGQFHFTPFAGWQSDPNGLVYFDGVYHRFFQHGSVQLNLPGRAWGHAVSRDLVTWELLPPALAQDGNGFIYSGSAVADEKDVSGFFDGRPGLVAFFTYHRGDTDRLQAQALAYSRDGGKTFEKWDRNPIIPYEKNTRDPKVFWHEASKKWVMVLAGGEMRIFTSDNLRDWKLESRYDGEKLPKLDSECPDLFEMTVEGGSEKKWVYSAAGRWYVLGDFDGKLFKPTTDRIPMNYGPDFYAFQSFGNVPGGRHLGLAWARRGMMKEPGRLPFTGGHSTVPLDLSLRPTADGPRLFLYPVKEIETLREVALVAKENFTVDGPYASSWRTPQADIELTFTPSAAARLGLRLFKGPETEATLVYDAAAGQLVANVTKADQPGLDTERMKERYGFVFDGVYEAPVRAADGRVRLRVLIDHSVIEVFANEGAQALHCQVFPPKGAEGIELFSEGGLVRVESFRIFPMRSIWSRPAAAASGVE